MWDISKPSLGLYGINDRNDLDFPEESHDHGLVLMDQGKIVHAVQLERYTGRKHDHRMKDHLIALLKDFGLQKWDFDLVFSNNVLGQSMITRDGRIRVEGPPTSDLANKMVAAHSWWFDHRREAWLVNHELAHIFSAAPFYQDILTDTLLVHFDGGASVSNFSAFR